MQIRSSRSDVSRRAWNILRLTLLWARKGGVFVFKKRLVHELSHYLKTTLARGYDQSQKGALQYGDRQLSFDATPIIHVKMHRPNSMCFRLPHIPCINPHTSDDAAIFDFDDDDDDDDQSDYSCYEARKSFLIGNGEDEREKDDNDDQEQEINLKAERFISNFYEQLKLQRQFNTRRCGTESTY